MAACGILQCDQGGFGVTEKCCCFWFTSIVDEKWCDTPVNDRLSGVILDMTL